MCGAETQAIKTKTEKQVELITPEELEVQGNQERQLEWSEGI